MGVTPPESPPELPPESTPEPPPADDPRWLERAQLGDRDAQASLIRGLQDVWFRYCWSMLRDDEMARDATQETARRFLAGLAQFRGASRLRTWSLGIATNVCRELQRKCPRKLAGEPSLRLVRDDAAGPADQAVDREDQAALYRVVEALPDRQREAVVLRYFEGLSTAEAAEAMACSPGTVKATLSQALRKLRGQLEARA
ncbi:MAG: sigma-70 family RNA polymerase sigma factor [Planctomycetota bacterium]